MYALRARLLAGLGAQKRAVVDIGAALQLLPGDAALQRCKDDISDSAAGAVQDA
eukprot:CAMPEP_0198547918 /NCGR_PEP_ID=MMETSP1462-20131121/68512_1 /TAXON_ID=1333877 /ORGANISM="Brandtodinium nutriculum, Strain RCC3387" /LENGTH=53 /DNA_ID=CAMNT_0044278419 /DNA_START=3 /DNA_END=160 /DNA_ORIENTATION=+